MHLNVSVLGSLQVRLGTELITRFEFERVRALLVYLVVEAGKKQKRTALAYKLWPDEPTKTGLQNLRQTLAALRRALKDKQQAVPFLLTTRKSIAFNPHSDYSLDVQTFSNLIEETTCHKHRRLGVCSSCMQRLELAIALYREDFAGGLHIDSKLFEEWLLHNREQTYLQAAQAMAKLTDYHLQHNRISEAIHLARRQITLYSLCDIGNHQLIQALAADGRRHAAIKHYEEYEALLAKELTLSVPRKTATLYRQLTTETWQRTSVCPSPPHNLPKPITPFIGYQKELATIRKCLASAEYRLLVLTGIVGSGKSRIAIEAAWKEVPNFRDGVFYIKLDQVDAGKAPATIARVILPQFDKTQPVVPQLTAWLRDKEILLVLDQFDHLVRSDSSVLRSLLREAPQLHIIVTSQEQLKLQGERFLVMQGLDYPMQADTTQFETYSAVRFFVNKANQLYPGFALETAEDRQALIHICQQTGGIPRALELFVHGLKLFPLNQIVQEFEKISGWREMASKGVPKRQRSLRKMFESAWQRLSPEEQQALLSLSIFETTFNMIAAQTITQFSLKMLLSLQAKSWLELQRPSPKLGATGGKGREPYLPSARYRIPALFHRYTLQLLQQEADLQNRLRHMHTFYYMNLLRQQIERLTNDDYTSSLEIIRYEKENINQAHACALEHGLNDVLVQIEQNLVLFYMINTWHRENKATSRAQFCQFILHNQSAKSPPVKRESIYKAQVN